MDSEVCVADCANRRGLIHDGLAFFDDPRDAIAVLAANFFVESLEDLIEPIDLPSCFL